MKTCSCCEKSVEQGLEILDLNFCDLDCLSSFLDWSMVDLRAEYDPRFDASIELQ